MPLQNRVRDQGSERDIPGCSAYFGLEAGRRNGRNPAASAAFEGERPGSFNPVQAAPILELGENE